MILRPLRLFGGHHGLRGHQNNCFRQRCHNNILSTLGLGDISPCSSSSNAQIDFMAWRNLIFLTAKQKIDDSKPWGDPGSTICRRGARLHPFISAGRSRYYLYTWLLFCNWNFFLVIWYISLWYQNKAKINCNGSWSATDLPLIIWSCHQIGRGLNGYRFSETTCAFCYFEG